MQVASKRALSCGDVFAGFERPRILAHYQMGAMSGPLDFVWESLPQTRGKGLRGGYSSMHYKLHTTHSP